MSRWDDSFFVEKLLSSGPAPEFLQLGPQGTRRLSPPMEIQICSFEKALSIHLPVLWAAMRAFFARLSTLMLICSFREQSRHLFVSLACDCTYLYPTQNGWAEMRFLKTWRKSACDWLVGNGQRGSFPWETALLLSQLTTTKGIASWHLDAAAFSIDCVIIPPSTSCWRSEKSTQPSTQLQQWIDDNQLIQINHSERIVKIFFYRAGSTRQSSRGKECFQDLPGHPNIK